MAAALVAAPALAQDMSILDIEGDGMVSLVERIAVYPGMTKESVTQADTNADGMLGGAEPTAVAGTIIPTEG